MSAQGKGSGKITIQWPSNALKEAKKTIPWDQLRSHMPIFRGSIMLVPVFIMAYTSTKWFTPSWRYLVPDEIEGIVYQACRIDGTEESNSRGKIFQYVHEKINDPDAITTTILEGLPEVTKKFLFGVVAYLFRNLILKNDEAKQRYNFLKGFVGKLIPLPFKRGGLTRPTLGGRKLWDEEIYLIGALIKWCRGDQTSKEWEPDAKIIVMRKLNLEKCIFQIYSNLTDESHPLTKEVAAALETPNHETFFRRKAQEYHVECSQKETLRYPRWSYPDTPPERALSMVTTAEMFAALTVEAPAESSRRSERPMMTTAEEFAAMTITASAGSSRQPTGTNLPVLDFDDFLKPDAYEESIAESIALSLHDFNPEPEEAPPAAGGRSPKGKGRARESNSPGSQEGGDSRKGKEVVRKRPRGGK